VCHLEDAFVALGAWIRRTLLALSGLIPIPPLGDRDGTAYFYCARGAGNDLQSIYPRDVTVKGEDWLRERKRGPCVVLSLVQVGALRVALALVW